MNPTFSHFFYLISFIKYMRFVLGRNHSIANSSLFLTFMYLHSNFNFSPKIKQFFHFFGFIKFKKIYLCKKGIMQLFSADAIVFSKKILTPKKWKKQASKVAHNGPRPFFFTVQPRPQPTAQNWFFILCNFGTRHLFSYLWSK